jgi:hypothetical protein
MRLSGPVLLSWSAEPDRVIVAECSKRQHAAEILRRCENFEAMAEALRDLRRLVEYQIRPPSSNPIRHALNKATSALREAGEWRE